jgi:hypothetical protein
MKDKIKKFKTNLYSRKYIDSSEEDLARIRELKRRKKKDLNKN